MQEKETVSWLKVIYPPLPIIIIIVIIIARDFQNLVLDLIYFVLLKASPGLHLFCKQEEATRMEKHFNCDHLNSCFGVQSPINDDYFKKIFKIVCCLSLMRMFYGQSG